MLEEPRIRKSETRSSSTPVSMLIFDGDCAFCTRCVAWAERWIGRLPTIEPWQVIDLASYGLTSAQCQAAVQFVDSRGRVSSGEMAVANMLIHAGKGWKVLGWVIGAPGIRWLSGAVYRWVARHRHRLPGGTVACRVPKRTPSAQMENPHDRG